MQVSHTLYDECMVFLCIHSMYQTHMSVGSCLLLTCCASVIIFWETWLPISNLLLSSVCMCVCTFVYVCVCLCVYVCVCVYMCVYVHVRLHVHVYGIKTSYKQGFSRGQRSHVTPWNHFLPEIGINDKLTLSRQWHSTVKVLLPLAILLTILICPT